MPVADWPAYCQNQRIKRHLLIGALAAGLAVPLLVAVPAHAAKASFKVTAAISTTTPDVGQSVKITGKVSGKGSAKKTLNVQQRIGSGSWTTVATVKTSKKSKYSTSVTISSPGEQAFRVVAPKASKVSQGISPVRSLTAYKWLRLTRQRNFPASSPLNVVADQKSYPDSLRINDPEESLSFTADGKCTDYRARIISNGGGGNKPSVGSLGMDSRTSEHSWYSFNTIVLRGDGSVPMETPLNGARSIWLEVDGRSDLHPHVFFLTPEVRCSVDEIALKMI